MNTRPVYQERNYTVTDLYSEGGEEDETVRRVDQSQEDPDAELYENKSSENNDYTAPDAVRAAEIKGANETRHLNRTIEQVGAVRIGDLFGVEAYKKIKKKQTRLAKFVKTILGIDQPFKYVFNKINRAPETAYYKTSEFVKRRIARAFDKVLVPWSEFTTRRAERQNQFVIKQLARGAEKNPEKARAVKSKLDYVLKRNRKIQTRAVTRRRGQPITSDMY
jgi:hypothetical protein